MTDILYVHEHTAWAAQSPTPPRPARAAQGPGT